MDEMGQRGLQISNVLKKTMAAIEEGKTEIFEITEAARSEYEILKKQLEELQNKVKLIIKEVDILENQEKASRNILLNVSKNFSIYGEEDIRKAYENANHLQIKLVLKRQEETDIIKRRTDLELRIKNAHDILKRSENLISKVCVAFDFLNGDLKDITNALEDMNQTSILGRRVIQAQEDERQRIAMDIHDGPAQSLTNAVIKAEICERVIDMDVEKAKYEIKELKLILRRSIKDIRGIIYNLRPMALDDIGFVPTIQRYTENFQNETQIEVDFIILSKIDIDDNIKNIALFRIVQEALNNIQKHSKATKVKIKVEMTRNNIFLLIEDNGVGFDMHSLKPDIGYDGGLGLMNMKERIEFMSGNFEIKSAKSVGTKLMINIPMEK